MRLAYNGAPFHGWQTQPNAVSVQETLEKAMSMVMRMPVGHLLSGKKARFRLHSIPQLRRKSNAQSGARAGRANFAGH